jgi:hypothetical protein
MLVDGIDDRLDALAFAVVSIAEDAGDDAL